MAALRNITVVFLSIFLIPVIFVLYPHQVDYSNFAEHTDFTELEALTTQRKVKVNGVSLNVNEAGPIDSPYLLVFLHGFPETGLMNWHHQIVHFAKLGYRVIAPDQRGFNTSTKGDYDSINYLNAAEDLKELIGFYNHSKCLLVAHDWGGAVGWVFALKYPQLLHKYVVINLPHLSVYDDFLLLKGQVFKSWYMFFFQLSGIAEWKLRRDDWAWMVYEFFGTSNKGSYSLDDLKRYKQAWEEEGALTNMLGWYRFLIHDTIPFLDHIKRVVGPQKQVQVPTLLLFGEKDTYLDFRMVLPSASKEHCLECSAILYEDGTHWLPKDKPKEVNAEIEKFFKDFNPQTVTK